MDANQVLDIARQAVWLVIAVSAPAMLVGLVVGVVIGLLQAPYPSSGNDLSFCS